MFQDTEKDINKHEAELGELGKLAKVVEEEVQNGKPRLLQCAALLMSARADIDNRVCQVY